MKILFRIINLLIINNLFQLIYSHKNNPSPKCCKGSENFGIGLYISGTSCSDMITCCPSGTYCSSGKCKKRKIKRIRKSHNNDDISKPKDEEGPTIKVGDEIIKPQKLERKPVFKGPVKINWETFTSCLEKSGSKEKIILDIIQDYKNKKESDAMRKVFSELKNDSPLIIDCLNNQEHLT